ncbi:hypothetical protein M5W83_17725 [Paenibacillus thiaminolyticus]|uniref:Uncharacterized protein n=1 Tax=Paenibacillus thiaminolyticus TaxID=49283 RepID=A0AAP9DS74_PANTH|nr:hypothetical protein [Paenibacillus thiaminolyticus]MCY9536537.1 hypothetical protein [Paenibacillus thiaminolyticus]MCY9601562.1 hypothetical protein [Paenibacillus thiaminolyticus]MCY9608986.1 hypothetical protein [Paenibacillus thiaminolyticus]MCY9612187.1 hypothetical protein [Paenibacillus thiaminolyticus]MCY9619622.1 hypothetical protein [Paenibacillus thiaminolyticus]
MLFSRIVRLPSFMLVGEYCETLEEMRRVCRTLPFLHGSGLLPPDAHRYSIGLGMNGLFFAGIPYAHSMRCLEQAKQLTFHSYQGGIYWVFEADGARLGGKQKELDGKQEGLTLPEAVLPSGRNVVYEFRRRGNSYAESRLYIPVGRLSAEASVLSRFRDRDACRSKLAVA